MDMYLSVVSASPALIERESGRRKIDGEKLQNIYNGFGRKDSESGYRQSGQAGEWLCIYAIWGDDGALYGDCL